MDIKNKIIDTTIVESECYICKKTHKTIQEELDTFEKSICSECLTPAVQFYRAKAMANYYNLQSIVKQTIDKIVNDVFSDKVYKTAAQRQQSIRNFSKQPIVEDGEAQS